MTYYPGFQWFVFWSIYTYFKKVVVDISALTRQPFPSLLSNPHYASNAVQLSRPFISSLIYWRRKYGQPRPDNVLQTFWIFILTLLLIWWFVPFCPEGWCLGLTIAVFSTDLYLIERMKRTRGGCWRGGRSTKLSSMVRCQSVLTCTFWIYTYFK